MYPIGMHCKGLRCIYLSDTCQIYRNPLIDRSIRIPGQVYNLCRASQIGPMLKHLA